jgi:hypothetical protein
MKNMAISLVGDVVIAVHTANPPSDDEWQAYLKMILQAGKAQGGDMSKIRSLVVTEGGGPNAAQRRELTDALQKMSRWKDTPAAVVSTSPVVRGIVTVLSWFNLNIKPFSPDKIEDAFQSLHLSPSETPKIVTTIKAMRASLGLR